MQWTLVIGGAKGLGAEICRFLSAQGHAVIVHYNKSSKEAEEVAEICRKNGTPAGTVQGDFATKDSTLLFTTRVLKKFPEIKNIVYNVGNYFIGPASETSVEGWYDLFQSNLNAPFIIIQSLLPLIKKYRGGIVTIGTVGIGHVAADTYSTAYRCTKMGLLMLTKSLAKELASSFVNVNMVSPGYLENSVDLPNQLPMARPALLIEAARLVYFFLQDENKYITGQNIELAGGVKL